MPKAPRAKKPSVRVTPLAKPQAPAIRWKARGKYKCVVNEGVNCKGVHPALKQACWPGWNYDKAAANGTLVELPMPAANRVIPTPTEARPRRLPYSTMQGIRFDNDITKTVKLSQMHGLPPSFWFDSGVRTLMINKLKGITKQSIQTVTRLRNAVKMMMPETPAFWSLMHHAKLVPVETQTPVAFRSVGTKIDVKCQHAVHTDVIRIIEIKLGCEHNWSIRGLPLLPAGVLGNERRVTTHGQHLLQTWTNHVLFKASFPRVKTEAPWLVRVDRHGAHVYVAPEQANLLRLLT
jgi:hypothetical protein